jgi:hypothetical protein
VLRPTWFMGALPIPPSKPFPLAPIRISD